MVSVLLWRANISFLLCLTACATPAQNVARQPASEVCGAPSAPIARGLVECLTRQLVQTHFPELESALNDGRIEFREFQSKAYFLKTSFIAGKLDRDPANHRYFIDVNPIIYDPAQPPAGPPSIAAIEGILAHELIHLVDYETLSPGAMVRFGTSLILNPSKIERGTDERAFKRGYAPGIRAYREWIYKKLSPKDLKVKRRRYYKPEEIDEWLTRSNQIH